MTSQPTSVAKPGSTIPAKPAGSSSSARLSTSPTARRKVSSEIYMAAPPRLPCPVRNVRIDTSLISQFSQAQPHSDDGAGGGGQPAGPVVLPASTMTCTPASLSQEVGAAASMGSSRFRRCLQSACFLALGRQPICGGKDVDGLGPE